MPYKHTQIGYLIIIASIAIALLLGTTLTKDDFDFVLLLYLIFIFFILGSFISLKVSIDEDYLKIKFSYGIIKKKFILSEITSVKIVKNHWYSGWGIRKIPHGWLYNVSGLDAVEIKLKNNKTYRIGTDEPEKLEDAIKQAIK